MNLSDITTPAELEAANQEPAVTLEQALGVISEMNPAQTLALATTLVGKLKKFHVHVSNRNGIDNPQAWACDAGILAVALNCLEQIEL